MKTHRRSGLCVFACSSVLLAGDSRFNRYKIKNHMLYACEKREKEIVFLSKITYFILMNKC